MKTRLITSVLLVAVLFAAFSSVAQEPAKKKKSKYRPFEEGSRTWGLSVGSGIDYDYYGDAVSLPAYAITYDRGVWDHVGPGTIGIGGIIGWKSAYYDYDNGYRATWNNYIVGARVSYHFVLSNPRLDPYVGLMLGVRFVAYEDNYYSGIANPYAYSSYYDVAGPFAGIRYNLGRHFNVYAELGYDITIFRAGIGFNN